MKTVEVSQSALESLQKMVEQLQGERDALYNAVMKVVTADHQFSRREAMDECILLVLSMKNPEKVTK